MQLHEFIRPAELPKHTGNAYSTNYADVREGLLPPPVKLGRRASGWVASEIAAVQQARISGKTEEEIKTLVRSLVEQRGARAEWSL